MNVRVLNEGDAGDYQRLRLRALKDHPEAFGSSDEEELNTPMKRIAENLKNGLPESATFGAFIDDELMGIVAFQRHVRKKVSHRAIITSMYVLPEARSKGTGRALMNAAISHGKSRPGVEDVILAVTVGNDRARALYASLGFVSYSIDPRYIKWDGQYFDIEWMILSLV